MQRLFTELLQKKVSLFPVDVQIDEFDSNVYLYIVVSVAKVVAQKEVRKEEFVAAAAQKRDALVNSKRRSVIEPRAANPFGDFVI